jgi:hypothetical protein
MFVRLLIMTLLIPSLATADAVWHRTNGGAVVQVGNTCSLIIDNTTKAAILTWTKEGMQNIAFQGSRLEEQHYDVQIRIGDTWLGHNLLLPADVYVSRDKQTLLTVPITESVDDLLRNASQIAALLSDREITVDINKTKMPTLMAATAKCRAQLR